MHKYECNVNILNVAIKRNMVDEWIRKHDPHIGSQNKA